MIGYAQQMIVSNRDADQSMLGVRLGRYCIARDIPVSDVAEYFGVSRQTVYNWFTGVHAPNKLQSEKIIKFLPQAR